MELQRVCLGALADGKAARPGVVKVQGVRATWLGGRDRCLARVVLAGERNGVVSGEAGSGGKWMWEASGPGGMGKWQMGTGQGVILIFILARYYFYYPGVSLLSQCGTILRNNKYRHTPG